MGTRGSRKKYHFLENPGSPRLPSNIDRERVRNVFEEQIEYRGTREKKRKDRMQCVAKRIFMYKLSPNVDAQKAIVGGGCKVKWKPYESF